VNKQSNDTVPWWEETNEEEVEEAIVYGEGSPRQRGRRWRRLLCMGREGRGG
jgi:hypothetical protein